MAIPSDPQDVASDEKTSSGETVTSPNANQWHGNGNASGDEERAVDGHGSTKCSERDSLSSSYSGILHKVLKAGRVEENGIRPLPVEERKETRFFNIFTCWFSINSNILG